MKRSLMVLLASCALVLGLVPGIAGAQETPFPGCEGPNPPDFNEDGVCDASDDLNRDGVVDADDADYVPPTVGGVVITPPADGGVVVTPGANPQPLPPQAQTPPQARPQSRSEVLGVTQTRGSLVRTGLEAAPFAAVGAALIGAGAVLVMGARKRRDAGLPAS